jgi:hypothetical protein
MLLLGAEINSEIEAASAEMRMDLQARPVLGPETGIEDSQV